MIASIAASGMRDAQVRLNMGANNVANSLTPGYVPGRVTSAAVSHGFSGGGVISGIEGYYLTDSGLQSQVSLVTEGLNLLLAENAFAANAAALRTATDATETVLDALA